jgi:uncharacterized cupin superfamily protein
MKRIRVDDLPWEESVSPKGRFHSFYRNLSLALGGKRDVGTAGGGHPFDVQIRRVPPGASVCPFHVHGSQWEFFLVSSGEATIRCDDETAVVSAGDAFLHPPGTAHKISNTGTEDFVFIVIADNPSGENCFYPDSGKWMVKPARKVFRPTETDYFDGEE